MKCVVILCSALLIVGLSGCKPRVSGGNVGDGLNAEFFVGTWETQEAKVLFPAPEAKGKDPIVLFPTAATPKRKPLTFIQADGAYREEVPNAEGVLETGREGYWHYYQDTLILRLTNQNDAEMRFGVQQKGSRIILSNWVDWNGDGKKQESLSVELKRR